MRICYLQHVDFEGPGFIEQWARRRNYDMLAVRLFESAALPDVEEFDLLVVMGGPMSVHDTDRYAWLAPEKAFIKNAIHAGKAVLGVCLGAQLIAEALGAEVHPGIEKEIGWFPIEPAESRPQSWRRILPAKTDVFHWHGETFTLPEEAFLLASSVACPNQGFIYRERVVALQFHLEATPESVAALIANCRHELIDAPYIQKETQLQGNSQQFEAINRIMESVLESLR